jgi:hypothetical protein
MLLDQNKQMEALMSQNQALQDLITKISKNINGDIFLAMSHDDVENQSINPEFNVSIAPLKGQGSTYSEGENIRFLVKASRDCYIKVIYLSSTGEGSTSETKMNTLLFPNVHDQANRVIAWKPSIIGKKNELVVQEPYGKDIVTVVASLTQFPDYEQILREAHNSGGYYQTVTRSVSEAVHTRGIVVTPTTNYMGTSSTPVSFVSDTCFIITRRK